MSFNPLAPVASVGRAVLATLSETGRVALFGARAISGAVSGPFYFGQLVRQLLRIGYFSLPVVGLTAIFTGMVLALQSHTGFAEFGAETAVPTIIILTTSTLRVNIAPI